MNDSPLHPDLVAAIDRLGASTSLAYAEKIADTLFARNKDVSAQIRLTEHARVPLLAATVQHASVSGSRPALVVAPDNASIGPVVDTLERLAEGRFRIAVCASDTDAQGAAIVVGTPDALIEASESGRLKLRDYPFVALSDCDRVAELHSSDSLRHLKGLLLPAWERRTIAASPRMNVKATNLALDFCDEPEELLIEETSAKARLIAQEAYHVSVDEKIRLLLGMLRGNDTKAIVFCNLKATAEELGLRLIENGIKLDYVLGNMPDDRKFHLGEQLRSGEVRLLVVTDEGAEGLGDRLAPLLVNYDIPLEGADYLKRYGYLDDSDPRARIVNMVCERYVYGLPAIERVIDAKIEAVRADPSAFADDASAKMSFDRPKGKFGRGPGRLLSAGERRPRRSDDERGDRGDRGYRGERGERGERGPRRDDRRRGDGPRDGRPREGRPDDESAARDAIRKRIADATGGSLDMDTLSAPRDRAETRESGEARGSRKPRREGGRGQGRGPARDQGRDQGRRDRPRDDDRPTSIADPYAISSEERMRLYKEKYGKRDARRENRPETRFRDRDERGERDGRRADRDGPAPRNAEAGRDGAKPAASKRDGAKPDGAKPDGAKKRQGDRRTEDARAGGRRADAPREDRGGKTPARAPEPRAPRARENDEERGGKKKDNVISSLFKLIAGRRD